MIKNMEENDATLLHYKRIIKHGGVMIILLQKMR